MPSPAPSDAHAPARPGPARPARAWLGAALAIAACSSPPPPAPPAASRAAPTRLDAPPRDASDAAVATVNGQPVWASCVAAQAAALPGAGPDRARVALDQCVAFELLAQAAAARGLAGAAEVAETARAASVNRLVELDFEQRYRTPADLRGAIDLVVDRNAWRLHIVQLRSSAYARFIVAKGAPPELDAKAHALADQLAAELAEQTGLFASHLTAAAQRLAAGAPVRLETSDVKPMHQDDLVEPYARALYAIPEVGRTSAAIRTAWGWDVVLWTGGIEPRERTRAELAEEAFPEIRRQQFKLWTTQLARQQGTKISLDPVGIAQLDEGDPK